MHGFKPKTTAPQNLADGGIVDSVVAGAKRIAHLVSLGHGKKPEQPPQQPAAAEPQKAISQYSGMSAMKRREAEAGLKDGGPVRGPGTGISDSIKTEVPEGSYIMPADSTEQIGLGFGPKSVPVNLSNGEYEITPNQVQEIGAAVLDVVKQATHTPAAEQEAAGAGHGDEPGEKGGAHAGGELFFADGGQVGGFLPKTRTSGSGWRTDSVLAGTGEDVSEQFKKGNYGQAAGALVRGTAAAIPAAFADVGQDLTDNALTRGAAGFVRGLFGTGDQRQPSPTTAPAPAQKPAAPADPASQAGKAPAASSSAATEGGAEPAQASAPNNVTREGNSYSGKDISGGFTINGKEPGGGFAVVPSSAQGRFPDGQAYPIGAQVVRGGAQAESGPGFMGIAAPKSGGDRSDVLSAALTQQPGARGITANQLRVAQGIVDADQRDAATRYTADQQAATQRDLAAMREAGDTGRAMLREQGDASRAAASNDLARGELQLRQEAQGFNSRALQRQEALYAKYDAAKTPEERSQIAQQIRDLAGKQEPQNRFTVVPGGQEVDPMTQQLVTRPARVFNNQTGQFMETQPQQQAAPKQGEVRNGYRFKGGNPADQKSWEKV